MDWNRCDEIEFDTQYENSRSILIHTGKIKIQLNIFDD